MNIDLLSAFLVVIVYGCLFVLFKKDKEILLGLFLALIVSGLIRAIKGEVSSVIYFTFSIIYFSLSGIPNYLRRLYLKWEVRILKVTTDKGKSQYFFGNREKIGRKLAQKLSLKGEYYIFSGRHLFKNMFRTSEIKDENLSYFLNSFIDDVPCLLCHWNFLCPLYWDFFIED
jgi:hypothetical protein